MGKRKLLTGILIALVVMLAASTVYIQWHSNHLQIAFNRVNREHTMLQTEYEQLNEEYEKLYYAYYGYDKKILRILQQTNHVTWAKDSSIYIIQSNTSIFFSFYKKPKMVGEYRLYQVGTVARYFIDAGQVDNMKPHEFKELNKQYQSPEDGTIKNFTDLFIALPLDIKNNNYTPDTSSIIVRLKL